MVFFLKNPKTVFGKRYFVSKITKKCTTVFSTTALKTATKHALILHFFPLFGRSRNTKRMQKMERESGENRKAESRSSIDSITEGSGRKRWSPAQKPIFRKMVPRLRRTHLQLGPCSIEESSFISQESLSLASLTETEVFDLRLWTPPQMRSDPGTVLVQRLRVGRSKMGLIMWRTGWIRSSGLGSHLEEL